MANIVICKRLARCLIDDNTLCPPKKRCRVGSACLSDREIQSRASIDALPDECIQKILERLAGRRERCISACVSRPWLLLLSTILSEGDCFAPFVKPHLDLNEHPTGAESLSWSRDKSELRRRNFEGETATDVGLAAAAIGAGWCEELLIRGSETGSRRVTDAGLVAIARGFPSLRVLSLYDCPFVTDEGLTQIANGCPLLEELSLVRCAQISDFGVAAIARCCPKLSKLALNSCQRVGDHGLRIVGGACPGLTSISILDCPLVGDQGMAGLLATPDRSNVKKLKLQNLNISEASLTIIGIYGKYVDELILSGLNVTERGFWAMASAAGLKMLTSLTVVSCTGLTDLSLEAVAQGFPLLKSVRIRRCLNLSDAGLKAFTLAACSLKNLQIEGCRRLSLRGVLNANSVSKNLKHQRAFFVVGCMGSSPGFQFNRLLRKNYSARGQQSAQLMRHVRCHFSLSSPRLDSWAL
ncbi:EIN3-binding F-box protein 2-like [Wolffia australiana]